jgi:hypothetical protein
MAAAEAAEDSIVAMSARNSNINSYINKSSSKINITNETYSMLLEQQQQLKQ